MTVPESVVPTIGSLTTSILNTTGSSYIQNRSGVKLTAASTSGSYGSSITSYTFTGSAAGQTILSEMSQTNTVSIGTITTSGTITFSVYATDSRGRRSTAVTKSISATAYSVPTITNALAFRCNSNGDSAEEGTYIGAKCDISYYPLSGTNPCTVAISYQKYGDSAWTQAHTMDYSDFVSGKEYVMAGGNASTDYTYRVKIEATDSFTTATRTVDVSTAVYTMFFKEGGTGVAFGKVSEKNFAVEINGDWQIYHGGFQLRPVYYGSEPPSNPVEGLIWLEPV